MKDPTKDKTEWKKCPDCEGTGHTGLSNCCGAPLPDYPDRDICPDCKEHSDDECGECEGTGWIEDDTEPDPDIKGQEMREKAADFLNDIEIICNDFKNNQ